MKKKTKYPRGKISPEIISQRKYELIKRDPLAIEIDELVRGVNKEHLTDKEIKKRFPDYDPIEVQEQGFLGILEKELQRKWNVSCYPTGESNGKSFEWLALYDPHPAVIDIRKHVTKRLFPNISKAIPFNQNHFKKYRWIFLRGQGGYECADDEEPTAEGLKWKGTAYMPIPRKSIPIIIDPRGLTEKSKEELTEQVWEIVKETIKERKPNDSKNRLLIAQLGDPPELGLIYSMKNDIFHKYLKWYDIHIQERFGFRLIAHLEKQYDQDPIKREYLFNKAKSMSTIPKIRNSVKGEDTVEKGIKLILKAIHRDLSTKHDIKPIIEEYNCPDHGNECSNNCAYLKEFYSKIKRFYPAN